MPNRQRLLEMALKGLEADRVKLDEEILEIKRELGQAPAATRPVDTSTRTATPAPATKKRTMSDEARRRISEGMKRRYAELKKAAKATKK
jgi:hypothetical protein